MSMMEIWTYREQSWGTINLAGYGVEALDGGIGKIDEASNEVGPAYIVVDTGPWIFGKKVLLPAGVIERVDHDDEKVYVNRTKDQIKNAPEFDEEHDQGRGAIAAGSARTTAPAARATETDRVFLPAGAAAPPEALVKEWEVAVAPGLVRGRPPEEPLEHGAGSRLLRPCEQAGGRGEEVGEQIVSCARDADRLLERPDHALSLRFRPGLPAARGELLHIEGVPVGGVHHCPRRILSRSAATSPRPSTCASLARLPNA